MGSEKAINSMTFKGAQRSLKYVQTNNGRPESVFPLLCPVREKDWLDGWTYEMIHSSSGLIEQDCVFSTPGNEHGRTIWQVVRYDKKLFEIEFVRLRPEEHIVKITIMLSPTEGDKTKAEIDYQYTSLSHKQNEYILNGLEDDFRSSMLWWEKAINHYLETGEMLKKE